ncbi:pentapeptide repeat-containing protein [Arthrobacter sp. TMN-50]
MADSKKSAVGESDISRPPRKNPPWWVRDGLVALTVGGLLLAGQAFIDDRRTDREQVAAAKLSNELSRIEDLRFIRERSAELPPQSEGALFNQLPFAEMDLSGQNLSNLDLRGADFTSANLTDTKFFMSDLRGAIFRNTVLTKTSFEAAKLEEATFHRVSLRGTNFSNSNGGIFSDVCWDEKAILPPGQGADVMAGLPCPPETTDEADQPSG